MDCLERSLGCLPPTVCCRLNPGGTFDSANGIIGAPADSKFGMDTAKAIGVIVENPEFADVVSLEGVADTKNHAIFTIAVPTTAGTAAEVTINYVITDPERVRKFVCVDTNDIPDVAVVDPDMPVQDRGEDLAVENSFAAGVAPRTVGSEVRVPAGSVSPSVRNLILVPPEGRADLVDGRPLLSASQLESYLECPYKWFSLRRLGLGNVDAGFSGAEMGTFAHRVLEMTHRTLLDEAVSALGGTDAETFDPELAPTVRIPGSRATLSDVASVDHAAGLLERGVCLRLRGARRRKRTARGRALRVWRGEPPADGLSPSRHITSLRAPRLTSSRGASVWRARLGLR